MSKEALTKAAQRSISDTAFPKALEVEVRMSKVFTLDPGMLGSASFTSVDPRDVAPVWIGDLAETSGAVQSPDAIDRNLAFDAVAATSGAVQSPDAMDRNLALSDVSGASGAVQSPDAIERNLEQTISGDDTPGPQIHLLGSDF